MTGDMHVAGQLTALGWTLFALYLVAAGLAFRAATICRFRSHDPDLGRIWRALGFILAALGFNKPLDLQTRLIELGRWVARNADLSPSAPKLHLLFFLAFILPLLALFAVGLIRWRILIVKSVRQLPLAAGGCALVGAYIVIRAVAIDRVDQILLWNWERIPFLWLLEAGGLLLILAQALRQRSPDD